MKIKVFNKEFEIHTTPMEKIYMDPYLLKIELDDANENRYVIVCESYTAIKIIDADFVYSKYITHDYCLRNGRYQRYVLEYEESDWVKKLGEEDSDFGSYISRHFVLPLQEIIIEFVASEIKIIKI